MRTILVTTLALVAFAANSLLCRAALAGPAIDAVTFTTLRIASGALVLVVIVWLQRMASRLPPLPRAGVRDAAPCGALLFGYAIAFSLAYRALGAATGALILFGVVQLVMLGAQAWRSGLATGAIIGAVVAFTGLVVLVAPGVTAPDPLGATLMAGAGIAWGLYSLRGGGGDPLARTAANFVAAVPLAFAATLIAGVALVTPYGATLALVSGAVTSGLGYVVWYAALRDLDAGRAGVVQLAVPVIATLGAELVLAEPVTWRTLGGGGIVLAGIAGALAARRKQGA